MAEMKRFSCISSLLLYYFIFGKATTQRTNSIFNVVKSFQNIGPTMCKQRCSQFMACTAVSFKTSSLYCELLKDHSPAMLVEDAEFKLYDAGTFEIDINACWPNPCTVYQRCIVSTTGCPICENHSDQFSKEEIHSFYKERYKIQNIAPGKPTFQYPDPDYPYDPSLYEVRRPSRAIDGNVDTFSHTGAFDASVHHSVYWMIDLQNDFPIEKVVIINRKDCCGYRFRDVDITVGQTETDKTLCGHFVGPGSNFQHIIITCPELLVGRFVKLTLAKMYTSPYFNIAEVEVHAYA